jgi:cyclomaltodextrinase
MWLDKAIFYQIYPLGFCGAPRENDGKVVPRILKVKNWIAHIKDIGANAVYFSPVFQSDSHGYDTRDYRMIDCRLGSNKDFTDVCRSLHENGIKVVIDGVFNHVGRSFWAFRDVLEKREQSVYKNWFRINFNGNDHYNDNLDYEDWEGHHELVKLNLENPEVRGYIFDSIGMWVNDFDIDGLRLDVAYCLDKDFLAELRTFCNNLKNDFCLIGEIINGDYKSIVNERMCHSCTNYECYKGIYSSFNDMNMFEISYSLNRQFGNEEWVLYKGMHLLNFLDNHDVTRIASILKNRRHLRLAYGMLFTIPGIPCIYYGSEWGTTGLKKRGSDYDLRPFFEHPENNDLTQFISKLADIHLTNDAICYGNYKTIQVTNHQLVFERNYKDQSILIAINASDNNFHISINRRATHYKDLINNNTLNLYDGYSIGPYSINIWEENI